MPQALPEGFWANKYVFAPWRITRLARCAFARTGTHAGIATVPRTVATLTGCPVRVSQYCRTKKARQKALLSLLERITRLELATSTLARWRSTR